MATHKPGDPMPLQEIAETARFLSIPHKNRIFNATSDAVSTCIYQTNDPYLMRDILAKDSYGVMG